MFSKEKQVQEIIPVVDAHRVLTTHEAKIAAQFGKKLLQVLDDCGFQILFGVGVLEAQEVEQVRVFESIFITDEFALRSLLLNGDQLGGIPRKCDAFVEGGVHLAT